MPSKNPRLSVVLTPSVAATLAALSEASGDSASSLVRGLLEQVEPALQRMLQLLIAANAAKGQIGAGVGQTLNRVVHDLEDAMAVADSRTNRVMRDLVDAAEKVKPRRRGVPSAGARSAHGGGAVLDSDALFRAVARHATPVPVTRGSGTGKTRQEPLKPSRTKGGKRGAL
jgi:hypothetical protein